MSFLKINLLCYRVFFSRFWEEGVILCRDFSITVYFFHKSNSKLLHVIFGKGIMLQIFLLKDSFMFIPLCFN